MAKLKKVKKLNNTIKKQLAPFKIEKVALDKDFYYYCDTAKIGYTIMFNDLQGKMLLDFVKERFDYTCKYPFMLFLLHEVGHHLANDNIIDDIAIFCDEEKDKIQEAIDKTDELEEIKKLDYRYFSLPDEIMATQWAVNFMKKHPRKTKKMWKEIAETLIEFYQANDIDYEIG